MIPSDAEMPRFRLASGYEIPRIVVGLWQLSAGHRQGAAAGPASLVRGLEPFVDAGLDTFDCADIYTGVEELLGALARRRPGRIRVHTKFVPDRDALARIDRGYVERIIDRSLGRLAVERLDLVQFHWWDWAIPGYVETAGWLDELRIAGKIRLLGTTNFDSTRLRELEAAGIRVASNQVQYSLLDRRPERSLAAHCGEHDTWMLAYGTLAGGFLTERWLGTSQPHARWANRSLDKYALVIEDGGGWEAYQRLLEGMAKLAAARDVSVAALATAFVLDRPQVAAAIIGARDARRLPDMLDSLTLRLSDADRATIERMLADLPGPPGEVYELERDAEGRHAAIMRMNLNRQGA